MFVGMLQKYLSYFAAGSLFELKKNKRLDLFILSRLYLEYIFLHTIPQPPKCRNDGIRFEFRFWRIYFNGKNTTYT